MPEYSESEKPVLVVGASGFVGSHIVRLLVQQGRTVRAMFRRTSNTRAVDGLNVEIHYGDVLDSESLARAMQGCCTVFYSALDARFWLSDPAPLYRNNVEGLINALDVALAGQDMSCPGAIAAPVHALCGLPDLGFWVEL